MIVRRGDNTATASPRTPTARAYSPRTPRTPRSEVTTTGTSFDKPSVLPPGFDPRNYLHCSECNTLAPECKCGIVSNAGGDGRDHHGEDSNDATSGKFSNLMYVMPAIPQYFGIRLRIERWALLVAYHPLLGQFDTASLVAELPDTFDYDLATTKVVVRALMFHYKKDGLKKAAEKLSKTTDAEMEELRLACDYGVQQFFAGNWSLPTLLELTLLNNAIQISMPKDFDPETRTSVEVVIRTLSTILDVYETLQVGNLDYRLEDTINPA